MKVERKLIMGEIKNGLERERERERERYGEEIKESGVNL